MFSSNSLFSPALLFFLLLGINLPLSAQDLVQVAYDPTNNVQFEVPADWQAQLFEGGYLMQSNLHEGYLAVLPVEGISLAEMEIQYVSGISFPELGIELTPIPEELEKDGLRNMPVRGQMGWQPIEGYLTGVVLPDGSTFWVISGTDLAQSDDQWAAWGQEIAQSLKIGAPKSRGQLSIR
ncbi:MAG: hypothetical protein AAF399_01975 [Bacteroidota bacterium]